MNKKLIMPLILVASMTLTACKEDPAAAPVKKEDAVAAVNGQYISKTLLAELEKEIAQRSRGKSYPKEKLVEELVQRELLVQDAIQKQLDKSADFAERIANIKRSLLSQAAMENYVKSNPISDAELQAEYDKNMGAAAAGKEFKARHILVKTEDEAKAIIAELTKGTDFIELAKSKSTGPSGPNGGDLGWFTADRMVAPFSEAVIALENNKFTTEAVKTQFGWHIILREDSREKTPPPFESVKEQIRPTLQRQKMMDFIETLRKQAKIEILLPKEPVKVEPVAAPTPATTTP